MADKKFQNEEDQEMTVTLTLDDDTEVECVVLTIFNAGEGEYIALLPMEGADSEEGEEPGCGCFWEPGGICNSLLAISIIVC